jgi:phenylpropionate dioxygenase-like ring-hydroxylating dioxygenase large terminal subunit
MPYLRNVWYVAAWSHEVSDRLLPRTILEQPVVLYRKANGDPVALADRCPHRFAPLHLGRLKGDSIECGYHGLQFDGSGVCVDNPHGNHAVSRNCFVRVFPLAERYGALWIWPGRKDLADPKLIPDFDYLSSPHHKTIHGGTLVRANYQLINDNLMDASHTQYVHMDLLGTDAFRRSTHKIVDEGSAVHSNYLVPDSAIPNAYREYFENPNQAVDYAVNFRWLPAGLVRNRVSLTPVGRPSEEGIHRIGSHFMTPETGTTTHYFFSHTRNFQLDDPRVDERIRDWQKSGLMEQDGPMLEAVQSNMGTEEIDTLHPVYLSIDAAAIRVRRVLSQMIKEEIGQSAAAE